VQNAPAQTSTAIPALAPLTVGTFPHTTDGRLAKVICDQWAGLRTQYVSAVVNESPYQLNQWFSGPAWAKVQSGFLEIGDDPVYTKLSVAFSGVTVGDMADDSAAQQADEACEAGA
jgi:hypothetical protein